jgi:hypothetical protein
MLISNRADSFNHSKSPRTRKPVRPRARREVRVQIDEQLEDERALREEIWGAYEESDERPFMKDYVG